MRNQHPACSDKNPDFAVDLGTSPHGLSAELLLPIQQAFEAPGNPLPVDKQAPQGRAVDLADVLGASLLLDAACALPEVAARRPYVPVSLTLTEEQRDELDFAVTCQLEELAECDEVDTIDVQQAMSCLYGLSCVLNSREDV